MRRKCAWCGSMLGHTDPLDNDRTTHGICLPCSEAVLASAEHTPDDAWLGRAAKMVLHQKSLAAKSEGGTVCFESIGQA
jgi:hypothetical protein